MPEPIELFGGEQLAAQLDGLSRAVAGKIIREAMKPAAKIMEQAAKAAAPVDSGLLQKSIRVKGRSLGRGRYAMMVIASTTRARWNAAGKRRTVAKKMSGSPDYDVFYGGWVEYGHRIGSRKQIAKKIAKVRATTRRGVKVTRRKIVSQTDARGAFEGRPYLRPAFDAHEEQAVQSIAQELQKGIDAAL